MKFAIVDRRTKQVYTSYEADSCQLGRNVFGGPWNDPSVVEHVKIPSDLQYESLAELEPYDGQEQVGTQMVQVGESPAYDEEKKPIKGLLGAQLTVPKFEEQPVMIEKRLMRRKQ